MSKIEKLKEKFYSKPIRNDITFDEVVTLSEYYGCFVKTGGKHVHIVHRASGTFIPIPRHGNLVKEVYIKELKMLFDKIREKEGDK